MKSSVVSLYRKRHSVSSADFYNFKGSFICCNFLLLAILLIDTVFLRIFSISYLFFREKELPCRRELFGGYLESSPRLGFRGMGPDDAIPKAPASPDAFETSSPRRSRRGPLASRALESAGPPVPSTALPLPGPAGIRPHRCGRFVPRRGLPPGTSPRPGAYQNDPPDKCDHDLFETPRLIPLFISSAANHGSHHLFPSFFYNTFVELFNKKRGLKNQPSSLLTVNSYFLFLVRTRVAPAAAARTKVPTAMPAAPVTGLLLPSPLLVLSS